MQEPDFHKLANEEKRSPSLLARNLRFLRKLKGLSQQQLADELQLNRHHIASYESGVVEPKIDTLLALARFFDLAPVPLLREDLSKHASRQLPSASNEADDPLLWEVLRPLVDATSDVQKVYDGFVEFHALRKSYGQLEASDAQSLSNDFENLLEIVENMLEVNWAFIQKLQDDPDR